MKLEFKSAQLYFYHRKKRQYEKKADNIVRHTTNGESLQIDKITQASKRKYIQNKIIEDVGEANCLLDA